MKIVLIGAGSFVFAPTVVEDVLVKSKLNDFEFAFVDVNERSTELMAGVAKRIADSLGLNVAVSAACDREEALRGANYVITSVAAQGGRRWMMDYAVCEEEGIPDLLRECGALGGITYGIRNITLLLSICEDMERICPAAVLLNVSNPLTKVQTAIHRYTKIRSFGFCDVAKGGPAGNEMIAGYLGRDVREIDVLTAGINHFAWILSVRDKHTDDELLPRVLEIIAGRDDDHSAPMFRIYEQFGALPAALHHHTEFLPPYRDSDKIDAPPFHGSDAERDMRVQELTGVARGSIPYADAKLFEHGSWEHPGLIAVALSRKEDFYQPMLNVPNDGYLPQLPPGNIVEVPVQLIGGTVVPRKDILLPEKAAAASVRQSEIAEIIARAAVEGSRELAHEAVDADPAIDRKEPAHRALERMLNQHLDLIPQFKLRQ